MGQAHLVIEEMQREVCAVAVCHGTHPSERVPEAVFELLPFAAFAVEDKGKINRLRNPRPIQLSFQWQVRQLS